MVNISKIIGILDVTFVRGGGDIFKMAASEILCYDNMKQSDLVQRQIAI